MAGVIAMSIARYNADGHCVSDEVVPSPTWDAVRAHIASMNRHEVPSLWLYTKLADPSDDSDDESLEETDDGADAEELKQSDGLDHERGLMTVLGGNDLFHISIADSTGDILEAVDPTKVDETDFVDVWTSDQGFSTLACNTWNLAETLRFAKLFFETGKPAPEPMWE
jgi:hypothetical protein